jgi:hypothetical protein
MLPVMAAQPTTTDDLNAPAQQAAKPPKGGLARIRNVEIFSTGRHRDKEYTHEDLDDIARNFKKNSWGEGARVRPPVVVGHEEDQELLDNSGIPKMGQPDSLWTETVPCRLCGATGRDPNDPSAACQTCLGTGKQGLLMANLARIPASIAKLINARAYDSVSSEIYPEPPEGVPGRGKMLRRIALLGGELPHLKNLKELPWADYEEYGEKRSVDYDGAAKIIRLSKVRPNGRGGFDCFSEVQMNPTREEMLAKMAEYGADKAKCDAMSDDELREALKQKEAEQHAEDDLNEEELAKLPKDQAMAKYADHFARKFKERGVKIFGDDFDAKKTYTQGAMAFDGSDELRGKNQAGQLRAINAKDPHGDYHPSNHSETLKFSDAQLDSIVQKVTAKVTADITASLKPIQQDIDRFKEDTKKDSIQAFIDSRVKAGKISSRELDRPNGRPNIMDRLMATNGTTPVFSYSEKGKRVEMTALDQAMAEIDARQPVRFGEQAASGKAGSADGNPEDLEIAKVSEHYESFAENFRKIGTTKAEFVDGFKNAKKMRPEISADDFLNVTGRR